MGQRLIRGKESLGSGEADELGQRWGENKGTGRVASWTCHVRADGALNGGKRKRHGKGRFKREDKSTSAGQDMGVVPVVKRHCTAGVEDKSTSDRPFLGSSAWVTDGQRFLSMLGLAFCRQVETVNTCVQGSNAG
jgi:hypothetical protein